MSESVSEREILRKKIFGVKEIKFSLDLDCCCEEVPSYIYS